MRRPKNQGHQDSGDIPVLHWSLQHSYLPLANLVPICIYKVPLYGDSTRIQQTLSMLDFMNTIQQFSITSRDVATYVDVII